MFVFLGDRYGWFTLDGNTGKLTITGNVDRELASSLTVWVEAKDSGTPSLSSFEEIIVNVSWEC